MSVKIFWIEPTDRERCWLRRFQYSDKRKCESTAGMSYCNAMHELGEFDVRYTSDGYIDGMREGRPQCPPKSDPRWPTKCEACGRAFDPDDEYQLFGRQIYVCLATGWRGTKEEAPPGACWDAWWISERRKDSPTGCGYSIGDDHRSLVVKCPDGHEWHVDARASNCDKPSDNAHHCWVRHGKPEDGTLHVDKNGNTCGAGGGSIQTPKWHGFLRNGELHE